MNSFIQCFKSYKFNLSFKFFSFGCKDCLVFGLQLEINFDKIKNIYASFAQTYR